MNPTRLAIYIILMAGTTYLIRMIPFTFFRKKVTNRFFKSFLYYVPYAVLSAMTFPAVFFSTGSVLTAGAGTAAALILAFWGQSLTVVAASAAIVTFLVSLL
ncbi:MAG: AzlD domain-containing protein [Lachnospiraceae bacterium]|nr:AzlD domain-containing protein [Lachnospiraceae bacterium]